MDTATMQFCAMAFLLGILFGFFISRVLYMRSLSKKLAHFIKEREEVQVEVKKLLHDLREVIQKKGSSDGDKTSSS